MARIQKRVPTWAMGLLFSLAVVFPACANEESGEMLVTVSGTLEACSCAESPPSLTVLGLKIDISQARITVFPWDFPWPPKADSGIAEGSLLPGAWFPPDSTSFPEGTCADLIKGQNVLVVLANGQTPLKAIKFVQMVRPESLSGTLEAVDSTAQTIKVNGQTFGVAQAKIMVISIPETIEVPDELPEGQPWSKSGIADLVVGKDVYVEYPKPAEGSQAQASVVYQDLTGLWDGILTAKGVSARSGAPWSWFPGANWWGGLKGGWLPDGVEGWKGISDWSGFFGRSNMSLTAPVQAVDRSAKTLTALGLTIVLDQALIVGANDQCEGSGGEDFPDTSLDTLQAGQHVHVILDPNAYPTLKACIVLIFNFENAIEVEVIGPDGEVFDGEVEWTVEALAKVKGAKAAAQIPDLFRSSGPASEVNLAGLPSGKALITVEGTQDGDPVAGSRKVRIRPNQTLPVKVKLKKAAP